MSAAIFGANLLEEVQEESLDQLLHELRYDLDPDLKCILGVPGLDRLLDLFQYSGGTEARVQDWPSPELNDHDEHPHDYLAVGTSTSANHLHAPKPALIELGHSSSGTGKTNFLYHITAASILPKNNGGLEATVMWLDTDIAFSAARLHDMCVNFLNSTDEQTDPQRKQSIAEDALKHVHVFSISSSRQLLSVLDSLQDYLMQSNHDGVSPQKHYSLHRPLSLIILDSATAFYWTDRFDNEIARLQSVQAPGSAGANPPQQQAASTASQILSKLKLLQTKFDCVCIYTTTDHQSHGNTHVQPSSRITHITTMTANPNIPLQPTANPTPNPLSPWTLNATLSLTLTRLPVPQFASHMTIDECLRDRTKRQEAVSLNRIRVSVNEEWLSTVVKDREVKDAVGRLNGQGTFIVRLGMDGLVFE